MMQHPDQTLLIKFASGNLADALGLAVACHLEICEDCRQQSAGFEALGGQLLDEIEPTPLPDERKYSLMARLDAASEKPSPDRPAKGGSTPRPLRRFVAADLDRIRWRGFGNSLYYPVPVTDGRHVARLIRLKAGTAVPRHRHRGLEVTQILQGAFHDCVGEYETGSFIVTDPALEHQPTATPDTDCICLAVTGASLIFTEGLLRLVNPFLR